MNQVEDQIPPTPQKWKVWFWRFNASGHPVGNSTIVQAYRCMLGDSALSFYDRDDRLLRRFANGFWSDYALMD